MKTVLLLALAALSCVSNGQKTPENVIGIDLGTTYSCVGVFQKGHVEIVANDQGSRTTPSYVALNEKEMKLVGQSAKNLMGQCFGSESPKSGSCVVFDSKRLIGRSLKIKKDADLIKDDRKLWPFEVEDVDGIPHMKIRFGTKGEKEKKFAPEQISADILAYLKKTAEDFLGKPVDSAVITVPAYFTDSQRQATKDAGSIAGLNVLRLINEPTAAAMAYGFDKLNQEKKILVFDLGGGTFDVSVLSLDNGVFEVVSTEGDGHLGGQDFDNRIMEWIFEKVKDKHPDINLKNDPKLAKERAKIRGLAENAKRSLSAETTVKLDVPVGQGRPEVTLEMSRARFEDMCMDLFKSTLEKVQKALEDAKWAKADIDDVVLVGGSTRIPKVQEMLSKFFNNKKLSKEVNPDEAVAYGATLQAAILMGEKGTEDLLLIDVTPLSLGIETLNGVFSKVVQKNTQLPTKKTQTFSTAADNQSAVNIRVSEGERLIAKDNHFLGSFDLQGIPPAPRGVPQIEVTFDIDVNGILTVEALDKGTGSKNTIKIKNDKGRLTPEQIEKMIKEAETHREEDERRKANIDAKDELERYLYSLKDQLSDDKSGLSSKLSSDDKASIQAAIKDAFSWVDKNAEKAVKEDYEDQKSKVETIVNPIVSKLYGATGSPSQEEAGEQDSADREEL